MPAAPGIVRVHRTLGLQNVLLLANWPAKLNRDLNDCCLRMQAQREARGMQPSSHDDHLHERAWLLESFQYTLTS